MIKKKSKYYNKKIVTKDGKFDSLAELARWDELKLYERAGQIARLKRQVPYTLAINSVPICKYIVDFEYAIADNKICVEDVKGYFTDVSRLKVKMFRACYPTIELKIVDRKMAPALFRSKKKRR